MAYQNREVQLHRRPVGVPTAEDFRIVENTLSDPFEGELLVRNLFMSVDPYMRGRMVDRKSYTPPFAVGETLDGGAIGRVVQSRHPDFAEGDFVENRMGWREAFLSAGKGLRNRGQELSSSPSSYLGVLGMPGMTAYAGLLGTGKMKEGETVYVSGAAGAVGSLVGQIAKIKGGRAIGSAGSEAKVEYLRGIGFDHAFNYKDGHLARQIMEGAPQGLDIYFDNVGGAHLEAALFCMRPLGRIPLCGAISAYNDTEAAPGPRNLSMAIGLGLRLQGFLVGMYEHMRADFERDVAGWLASGEVRFEETVFVGIDKAPDAFIGLFTGANTGKMVVKLD